MNSTHLVYWHPHLCLNALSFHRKSLYESIWLSLKAIYVPSSSAFSWWRFPYVSFREMVLSQLTEQHTNQYRRARKERKDSQAWGKNMGYECSWSSKTNVLEGKQFGPKENEPSTYPKETSGLWHWIYNSNTLGHVQLETHNLVALLGIYDLWLAHI